jgi:hypothetical protein
MSSSNLAGTPAPLRLRLKYRLRPSGEIAGALSSAGVLIVGPIFTGDDHAVNSPNLGESARALAASANCANPSTTTASTVRMPRWKVIAVSLLETRRATTVETVSGD